MPAAISAVLLLGLTGRPLGPNMQDTVRRYATDRDSIERYYDVPLSTKGLARREALANETLEQLQTVEFGDLDRSGQVDWILLKNLLEAELRDGATERARAESMQRALPFAQRIVALEEARWTLQKLDPETAASEIDTIRREAESAQDSLREGLEKKEADPSTALRASKTLDGLGRTFKRWYDHYNGYKPDFSWWCAKPYEECAKVLEGFEKFLREEAAGQRGAENDPLVGDPIGRQRLEDDLKREMLAYTADELVEIAEHEYAWCLKEMTKAARDMGCGDDWKLAVEKTKADHVPPGEQDDLVMSQGREAVEFVEKHDLVTLEPLVKETWRVNMLTAEQQKNWPFAFYGGQHMATSYPVPEMSHDTKRMAMRGNNRHFLRAVTHHELIPGHHLQIYMAERYNAYRRTFSTPFFVEGWALHWEMLLWDLDFPQSPMDRVGMLFWRMHRCARIVVSLKFHLGEMTPAQMIDHLVDRVGHERWTATSEVRRYVGDMYSPLYQAAYMIGGLQLRALYKDLVPKSMTPKQFHDAVLRLGPMPMEGVRLALTDAKLTRGFRPGRNVRASDH